MTVLLQIEGLHKSFGNRKVLNDFNLCVNEGEILGLLGPNGCGKSTLLNIVCNLLACDSGQVSLKGVPLHQLSFQNRSWIGFCPQRSALYPDLLPAENLHFFGRIYGLSNKERGHRVDELMHDFALEDFASVPTGQLSGGWQQRLHLAVSLVHRPELLVLDEPTSAVDIEARMDLWRLIERVRDSGTTILLTSHHLAEAERLCSRIALMRHGNLVALGSIPELLARAPGSTVAKVQAEDNTAIVSRAALLGWHVVQHANEISLFLPRPLSLLGVVEALEGTNANAVRVQAVTLHDAYLHLTGEDSLMQ